MYCHSCEVACKQENDIPQGVWRIRVIEIGPMELNDKLRLIHVAVRCMHCINPPCVDVCPTKAINKEADGIVLINEGMCIGCKKCIEVCPLGAITFNHQKNVMEKCTLCVHRVRKGLLPSCVQVCPTKALTFGEINNIVKIKQERHAKKEALSLLQFEQ